MDEYDVFQTIKVCIRCKYGDEKAEALRTHSASSKRQVDIEEVLCLGACGLKERVVAVSSSGTRASFARKPAYHIQELPQCLTDIIDHPERYF